MAHGDLGASATGAAGHEVEPSAAVRHDLIAHVREVRGRVVRHAGHYARAIADHEDLLGAHFVRVRADRLEQRIKGRDRVLSKGAGGIGFVAGGGFDTAAHVGVQRMRLGHTP